MRYKWIWIILLVVVMAVVMILSFNSNSLKMINYAFKANEGYGGIWTNLILRIASLGVSVLVCCSVLILTRMLHNALKNRRLCIFEGGCAGFLGS